MHLAVLARWSWCRTTGREIPLRFDNVAGEAYRLQSSLVLFIPAVGLYIHQQARTHDQEINSLCVIR